MLTPAFESCKQCAKTFASFVAFLIACVTLTGCTTVESQSFRVSQSENIDAAYIATDAEFAKYDQLLADEMGIYFPTDAPSTIEDIQRIREIFRDAFLSELQGYAIVGEVGPSTMKVKASLIDLRGAVGADIPGIRNDLRNIAAPGELLFLMELRDSTSDRVLARAADSASAPIFATAEGTTTDWSSVTAAAQNWAKLFREFLDQNLAR